VRSENAIESNCDNHSNFVPLALFYHHQMPQKIEEILELHRAVGSEEFSATKKGELGS